MPSKTGRLLTVFFAALFFINVGYLLLGFVSIPAYYERVTTLTIEPYGVGDQVIVSNEMVSAGAAKRSLTLSQYAIEQILFGSALVVLFGIVAVLIVWRARGNWFAWYTAFFLVFIAQYAVSTPVVAARLVPLWVYEVGSLWWPFVFLYFFLFPNGKPVPRRGLWVMLPLFLLHFAFQATTVFLSASPQAELEQQLAQFIDLFNIVIPVEIIFVFISQIYRYLRASTPLEKQQTKWFLFGLSLFIATLPLDDVIKPSPYYDEINLLIFAFVPLSIGIAILRYRLFDIGILVRRTLTYALVTALLAVVFFGSVVILQQVFSTATGAGQNELVTVLSTLAIATLFVPVRNRVQSEIDKRFNRKKYNAQHVLNDFANTVRDETNLENLTGRLMQVVDETMQPKTVSVWLKKDEKRVRSEG